MSWIGILLLCWGGFFVGFFFCGLLVIGGKNDIALLAALQHKEGKDDQS